MIRIFLLINNPLSLYNDLKRTQQRYRKTDTHWSFYGVFGAYQLICSSLDVQANNTLLDHPQTQASVVMDEGGKLNPPVSETVTFYQLLQDAK